MSTKKLGMIGIASMYLGVIMGAGFSSGRECWQFFGVFGTTGFYGTAFMTVFFVLLALMLTYIADSKGTADMGRLISPVENEQLINGIGYLMALIYYTLIISMSAAGGALLEQQFGLDARIGGIIMVVLTVATVLGDFERLSKVFNKLVPVLFCVTMLIVFLTIFSDDITQSGPTDGYPPASMAPNWALAAVIFTSYNGIGMIPMAGACAVNARDRKNAFSGAFLGGLLPGLMTIFLLVALLKDMAFSNELSLPMVGYALRINKPLSMFYSLILFGSMYATASSTFYAFSTKIKPSPAKKWILIAAAGLGFVLSQFGYKTLVKYLYPPQGYIGFVIIFMIIVNFVKEYKKNHYENES